MKVTKYEHACFVVEKDNTSLIVDPGEFTTDFVVPDNVAAIIITHNHADHFSVENIQEIIKANPTATVIAPADVTAKLGQYSTKTVTGGDSFAFEGFDLDFYGDTHALIHLDLPRPMNVGVLVEDRLYYPGDSFVVPDKSVDTLALPISAPWMKLAESIDFMKAVGARVAFPTHDALLSHIGFSMSDRIISGFAESYGTMYKRIDGETITVE